MKVIFVLAVIIGAVVAEHCRDSMDCDAKHCAANTMPHCVHHVCTCDGSMATTAATATCMVRADCDGMNMHGGCHPHCVDGMCKCLQM